MASSNSTDHGPQYGLQRQFRTVDIHQHSRWLQHGPWTLICSVMAVQTTDVNTASSSSTNHGCPPDLQQQHSPYTSTWTTGINMVWDGSMNHRHQHSTFPVVVWTTDTSMDHGDLSRRFSSENELFSISDSLPLPRARQIKLFLLCTCCFIPPSFPPLHPILAH